METLFIPSKNRVKNCKFIQYCYENKIPAIVVLEPEDQMQYREAYPNMQYMILPESNQGISFVRNFIKRYAEQAGLSHYWMSDDDVTNIYRREGTKMIKIGFKDLQEIEDKFKGIDNASLCSLEYQQFAWSATKPLIKDSFCDVFVFVNVKNAQGVYYRPYAEGKEDRDFAMQLIKKGTNTYRSTEFGFAAPKNGSNAGGLKETFYDLEGRESVCCDRMIELWGENVCYKIVKPDGRIDLKINWKEINSLQSSLF